MREWQALGMAGGRSGQTPAQLWPPGPGCPAKASESMAGPESSLTSLTCTAGRHLPSSSPRAKCDSGHGAGPGGCCWDRGAPLPPPHGGWGRAGPKQPLFRPKGIVGSLGKDGAATGKVPFPHLMGQELAEHTVPGEGVEDPGQRWIEVPSQWGGTLSWPARGEGERQEPLQPWPPTIKMGMAFKWPFLAFVL